MEIDNHPNESENDIDNDSVATEQKPAYWQYQEPDEDVWQGVNTELENVPVAERTRKITIDNIHVDSLDCGDKGSDNSEYFHDWTEDIAGEAEGGAGGSEAKTKQEYRISLKNELRNRFKHHLHRFEAECILIPNQQEIESEGMQDETVCNTHNTGFKLLTYCVRLTAIVCVAWPGY